MQRKFFEKKQKERELEGKKKEYFYINEYERIVKDESTGLYIGDYDISGKGWITHGKGRLYMEVQNDQNCDDDDDNSIVSKISKATKSSKSTQNLAQYEDEEEKLMAELKSMKVKLGGTFVKGFLDGKDNCRIRFEDGSVWKGGVQQNLRHGTGVMIFTNDTTGEVTEREAIANHNWIVCYKDQLHHGVQLEFQRQIFNITPVHNNTINRRPIAIIIEHVSGWVFKVRFYDEVWPRERKLNLYIR